MTLAFDVKFAKSVRLFQYVAAAIESVSTYSINSQF